ncbi:hypothetical protein CR156_17130 [Stenotrophomonas lactitubi]|uniref:hypothetical protein n=1 Tax=Stenotrophomonas lactitubi TaxID=2045214 RepID=UPI000C276236|nr:hypothetical protein [Stenotrophomonas lactitubi]PJO53772.1 hypothetical protein CR156_17130 [Stenotrophomonas lactitubi]
MGGVIINRPAVASVKPGTAQEEQLQLKGIGRLLAGFGYRYGSEVQLHEVLANVLDKAGHAHVREYRLDASNRADFWLDGMVIEVKVAGSLADALRQVGRYINLPQVRGVLLATTERWGERPLVARPAWQGKPFNIIRLKRQAL